MLLKKQRRKNWTTHMQRGKIISLRNCRQTLVPHNIAEVLFPEEKELCCCWAVTFSGNQRRKSLLFEKETFNTQSCRCCFVDFLEWQQTWKVFSSKHFSSTWSTLSSGMALELTLASHKAFYKESSGTSSGCRSTTVPPQVRQRMDCPDMLPFLALLFLL